MKISEIPLPTEFLKIFEEEGIEELYPSQEKAVPHIFSGRNLVVAIPTASGKTLIAYLAILRAKTLGMRSVYIVPLRALAREKYEELRKFPGLRVLLGMGDYDILPRDLEYCDVLVATSEKMDSILRHRPEFAGEIGVVVADEVHLLDDYDRGPTLEATITKILQINPEVQIVALSATISNSIELADWLNAEHIYDEWRPVPLRYGVYYDDYLWFEDGEIVEIKRDSLRIGNLVAKSIEEGGQCIVFVSRRKSAESLAEKLASKIYRKLSEEEKEKLDKLDIPGEEESRIYWDKLRELVKKGCAFHHAGLSNMQRSFVEDNFRKGIIKCIVATPTLAAGINLPARYVIVRDVHRYEGGFSRMIPVLEIKQMLGRAGRPKYDKVGYGIIVASSKYKAEDYMDIYILGEPEPISSKLGSERALRIHTLALIASRFARTLERIVEFYDKTFYGYQYGVDKFAVEEVVEFLIENEMVRKRGNKLSPTDFGELVSKMYIDPVTGIMLKRGLEGEITPFSSLYLVSSTPDMPPLYVARVEEENLTAVYAQHFSEIVSTGVGEESLSPIKTAAVLHNWIEEKSMDEITEKYGLGPGDVHTRVEVAEWLLYAYENIAKLFRNKKSTEIAKIRKRVRYGVKEDLLPLVALEGVGRVRARKLMEYGYDLEKLSRATKEELMKIPGIGEKVAEKILSQLKSF